MNDNGYIVCGWHTSDYTPWADKLRSSLDRFGEPHDIVQVEPMAGGWERNTMRKPGQILAALERHPNDVIIFLDVDCEVRKGLDRASRLHGDVALYFRSKILRNGANRLSIRSGTIVIRNTEPALRFVRRWIELGRDSPRGTVDQTTLPIALARTPGLSVDVLDNEFCAVAADGVPSPTILHDSASKGARKLPGWLRSFHHLTRSNGAYR